MAALLLASANKVVEFGPLNGSIHKIDIAFIEPLKNVYRRVLETLLA